MFGNKNEVVVGYDLSEEYAQISYMRLSDMQAVSISITEGGSQLSIPQCLYRRADINQWYVGQEAIDKSKEAAGYLIDKLYERAQIGDMILVGEEEFDALELLLLFVKRSLELLLLKVKKSDVAGIMFSLPAMNQKSLEVLEAIIEGLNLGNIKVSYQDRAESIYYYILNQDKELWKQDVMVYDYNYRNLKYYHFRENRNTTPRVAFVDEEEIKEMNRDSDNKEEIFRAVLEEGIGIKVFSSVYLIGDGFTGEWVKPCVEYICRGRRAFRGNNLYSRGACFGMASRLGKINMEELPILLGKNKLKYNVGMEGMRANEPAYLALIDGGVSWYDVKTSLDIILNRENIITLIITSLDGRGKREVSFEFEGLEKRPPKSTRIRLQLTMQSESLLRVTMEDLGFGEFYPSSHRIFTREIDLNEDEHE